MLGTLREEKIMKIARIEDLHCDAGWRDFSFLKVTTDDGLVGWSEYNEGRIVAARVQCSVAPLSREKASRKSRTTLPISIKWPMSLGIVG